MHDLLSCSGVLDNGGVVHLENDNSYVKLKDNTVFPVHQRGRLFYLDYVPSSRGSAKSAGVLSRNEIPRAGKIGSSHVEHGHASTIDEANVADNAAYDLVGVRTYLEGQTSPIRRAAILQELTRECLVQGISVGDKPSSILFEYDRQQALIAPQRLLGIVDKLEQLASTRAAHSQCNAPTPASPPESDSHNRINDACIPDEMAKQSKHVACVSDDKQVSSGRVHGAATETQSSEPVAVQGIPLFDVPMHRQSLWHRRAAHVDPERINNSIGITSGLQRVHTNKLCQCCVYSKQASKRVPAASVVRRAAHEPLSQVSVDLTQFSTPSLQGSKYLIVFVDTYSRYTWCKPLKSKSETSKALREFIQNVGCPREILSDWGTEFFGSFSQVCIDNYIRQVRSAPFSPFSNGIVERKNRELKGMIRSMILEAGGQASWWARAAIYSTHIHNRLYSSYTPTATPYELMWGHKPDLSHLRVFGSVCYPLVVPASKRVQANALKYPSSCGIFMGYAENCPGAVIFDPVAKKMSVRRDVVVDEEWRFHDEVQGPPTLHHRNPALDKNIPVPLELLPISDAVHVPLPKEQHSTSSRYIVEICAGTSSALRYHLQQDPTAQVLAIDVLPFEKVISHIPQQHRHRFHYVRMSMADLSTPVLRKLLYDAWSIAPDQLHALHWSHPCETYSEAHHNHNPHRNGLLPISQKAISHDNMLDSMANLLHEIATMHPSILITAENPVGLWQHMTAVQKLSCEPGWRMLPVAHYCANTSTTLGDGAYSKKPTNFLVYGVTPDFKLQTCDMACPHRLKQQPLLHKLVMCYNTGMHPLQVVERDQTQKAKIPLQIFHAIWQNHQHHLRIQKCSSQVSDDPHKYSATPKPTDATVPAQEPKHPRKSPHVSGSRFVQQKIHFQAKPPDSKNARTHHAFAGIDSLTDIKVPSTQPKLQAHPLNVPVDEMVNVGEASTHAHVLARTKFMSGKTFANAYGFKYKNAKGQYELYRYSDYKFDLRNGNLRFHTHKQPPKKSSTAAQQLLFVAAYSQMMDTCHAAMHTVTGNEPQSWPEMMRRDDRQRYIDAANVEIADLQNLDTLEVVDKAPAGETVYSTRMLWKDKPPLNGMPARCKGRLVVRNFKNDVNASVFAPVCRVETVRYLLSETAAHPTWHLHHIDICNAFCTAKLDKPIYIHIPRCMLENDPSLKGKAVKVTRALYGHQCSPRAFNQHLHDKIRLYGYTRSSADPCLYIKRDKQGVSYLLCYVDDILFVGCDIHRKQFVLDVNIDTNSSSGFKVRDYGEPKSFLGMEFHRDVHGKTLQITQTAYIRSVASRFNITADKAPTTPLPPNFKIDTDSSPPLDEEAVTEYRAMVGSILYAVHCCRPSCAHAVHVLSRKLHAPTKADAKLARNVIAFLLATDTLGLKYDGKNPRALQGFSDADWAGDLTNRRSTSGFVFMKNNAAVCWQSQLQPTVAHSTANAEYCALSDAGKEAMWLRTLEMSIHGSSNMDPTVIHEDNRGAMKWAQDPCNHKNTRHIDISYHSIREQVSEFKNLAVKFVASAENYADAFTKALPLPAFRKLFQGIYGVDRV
jgi:hypothetical protein